jgi:nucleotide-binding universal stress UspA family protein
MEVRRILVGLDGSAREAEVLSTAQDLAARYHAELILFRAVGVPPEIPHEAWQNPALTVKEFLEQHARMAVEALQRTLPSDVGSRSWVEIVVAAAWQGICTQAAAHTADLIVIGSHGYGALDRFLGTTAARVVNHAPCSVFVVRPPLPIANQTKGVP